MHCRNRARRSASVPCQSPPSWARRQLKMTGFGLWASSSPTSGAFSNRSRRISSRSHCRAALSMSARARRRDSWAMEMQIMANSGWSQDRLQPDVFILPEAEAATKGVDVIAQLGAWWKPFEFFGIAAAEDDAVGDHGRLQPSNRVLDRLLPLPFAEALKPAPAQVILEGCPIRADGPVPAVPRGHRSPGPNPCRCLGR